MFLFFSLTEKIRNTFVKSSNPPVEGGSVNLTCDASGFNRTREWMINGVELKPSENTVFYEEKKVLLCRVLTRKDNGRYTCNISNSFNGPGSVQISGPRDVLEGSTLKLSCSAESVPTAKYTWTKDGTTLGQSHEYTKDNIQLSDSGEYICRATNDVTLKSSEASHTVNVTGNFSVTGIKLLTSKLPPEPSTLSPYQSDKKDKNMKKKQQKVAAKSDKTQRNEMKKKVKKVTTTRNKDPFRSVLSVLAFK
uniref:Ig-like domain-containing protein n=1 Tax=Neogobius melanostomus TaxID=47308 RepID=A0A8C6TBZ1_9GOBI